MNLEADWWWELVAEEASVHILNPQMAYEGRPQTMSVNHYGGGTLIPCVTRWEWAKDTCDGKILETAADFR